MSGHSHFATIKHKKALTDAKRGKIFSKLARQIVVAVKEKGSDPSTNSGLRLIMEKAKSLNMPKDGIERATKKGTGELEGENLYEILYEGYGPGGIAILIECLTDNKNRALGEVKQILSKHNGKLADEGSVKWMFNRKGVITIDNEEQKINNEELEMMAIEAEAEDIQWRNNILDIYTKPDELEKVKKNIENKTIEIESASLDWVPKDEKKLDERGKQSAEKLFEALDENDAVQDIYSDMRV